FIAVKGFASDGHKYIPSALEKGAAAVIFLGPSLYSSFQKIIYITRINPIT
ncbi:MAG: hypothetical protein IIT54_05530, partial [Acetobacter sp.]|nr:hypothetical protein [Acetobacter sp.]